jgi:hypothetical protein
MVDFFGKGKGFASYQEKSNENLRYMKTADFALLHAYP